MSATPTATSHSIARGTSDGHATCVLGSRSADLRVTFAPALGMIACSMLHRREELLGQRRGLAAYARSGATMGIPLLYPWANRLGGPSYAFGGRTVVLDGGTQTDEHGLPIHGLRAAVQGWRETDAGADERGAWLTAELDAAARPDVLAGFPFPHVVRVAATLRDNALAIETTVTATGEHPVPVSFGYHPYLRLPGVPRERWSIGVPVERRLRTDGRGIPTGDSDPVDSIGGPLGSRTFDDGFVAAARGTPFVLAGSARRIEVRFDAGYPYAQLFAPANDDVMCFEPMTAPANALRSARAKLPSIAPGETFRARFTISVADR